MSRQELIDGIKVALLNDSKFINFIRSFIFKQLVNVSDEQLQEIYNGLQE